jgi:hypothetical protein
MAWRSKIKTSGEIATAKGHSTSKGEYASIDIDDIIIPAKNNCRERCSESKIYRGIFEVTGSVVLYTYDVFFSEFSNNILA